MLTGTRLAIRMLVVLLAMGAWLPGAATPTDLPSQTNQDRWCEAAIWSDVRVPSLDPLYRTMPVEAPSGGGIEDMLFSLSLSGGGYRAMLFHVGTLRRLNDAGLLPRLTLVSSVSGGSMAAAYLAYKWDSLRFNAEGKATNFEKEFEQPIRQLARTTIDVPSALSGLFSFSTTANELAKSLDRELFNREGSPRAMLRDIVPGGGDLDGQRPRPVFVLVATSLQTGEMWQFRAWAMGGPQVGWTSSRGVALADAVAASAGFPPVFASLKLDLSDRDPLADWFDCSEARDMPFGVDHRNAPSKVIGLEKLPEFRNTVVLADGGIRDNLGVAVVEETNRVRFLRGRGTRPATATFVSDGGATIEMDPNPASNWWSVLMRVTGIMANEPSDVRIANFIRPASLRLLKATDFEQFTKHRCAGEGLSHVEMSERENEFRRRRAGEIGDEFAYWGIGRMPKFHLGFGCPAVGSQLQNEVKALSQVPTRLASMDDALQARLINWGYVSAHQGIPYIDRLSGTDSYLPKLRESCSMPYTAQEVDPKGVTPSALDMLCFKN